MCEISHPCSFTKNLFFFFLNITPLKSSVPQSTLWGIMVYLPYEFSTKLMGPLLKSHKSSVDLIRNIWITLRAKSMKYVFLLSRGASLQLI